jgi:O-antigen/teichoic acid export membrane protein
LTYLFHTQIFNILVAAEYRGVSPYLPWLVLSSGLFNTGLMASLLIMSAMNTRKLIVPKITTAITGIGLNFLGAMWFGLPGVIAGSIIFAVFHLIWIGILNIQHSNR